MKLVIRRSRSRRSTGQRLILLGRHWQPSMTGIMATAQRLFAAIGRKDVAEAIKDALAASDQEDGIMRRLRGFLRRSARKPAPGLPRR